MATVFEKIIKIRETGAKQTERNLGSLVKTGLSIGAVAVAVKKMADELKKATQASIAQEQIFKRLKTAVDLTEESYDKNRKELHDLFAEQQKFTQFGDTDSAKMFTTLVQLSGDYAGSLEGLKVAQDLAATGMFDAASASRYVGMALAGNVTMLGRYIPELKETNPELAKLTTNEERAAYAMDLLTQKFGGTARQNIQTTAGAIQQAKNYTGDLYEMIGDNLSPAVGRAARGWTEFVQRLMETNLDTQIRQLQEMGAATEDIEALTLTNQLLKADEAIKDAGKSFDRAARQAKNFRIVGESVTDAIEKIDGEWTIDTEQAQKDIEKLRDEMTQNNEVIAENEIEIKKMDKALENNTSYLGKHGFGLRREMRNMQLTTIGLEDKNEGYLNARNAILKVIAANENATAMQNAYNEALEKYQQRSDEAINSTEKQEIKVVSLEDEIDKLGKKYKWTEDKIADFKKEFDDLTQSMEAQAGDVRGITFSIIPEIQQEAFERVKKSLDEQLASGKITQFEYEVRLKATTPQQIEDNILQPLSKIPEDKRVIETDLRTDGQKFLDEYSEIMRMAGDVASEFAQVYSNIIESRYQKELEELKGTRDFQKATNDERRVMEEDLNQAFADERKRAFRFEQAAASGQAAIQIAVKMVEAFPDPVLTALTAAVGAAQQAVIWSQPVPTYAEGGMLPAEGRLFIANERGQEAVLNAQATARLGRSGGDALNEGKAVGTTNNLTIQLYGDIYGKDEVVREIADMIVYLSERDYTRIAIKQ